VTRKRLVSISGAITIATAVVAFACSDDDETKPNVDGSQAPDAARPRSDSGGGPKEEEEQDGGGGGGGPTKPKDAAAEDAPGSISDAKAPRDANGPGEAGTECFFNRECQLALRCHDDGVSFTCSAGARGTGRVGADRCQTGDQCASSVCVEGPDGGDFCSDECTDPSDCAGVLPRCISVSIFPSKICVRQP
jgi:hypothetical protein